MNIVLNTALLLLALGLVTNAYGGGAPLPPLQTLPIGTTFSVDNEDLIVTQALEDEQPIFQEIGTPTIDNKSILDGVGTPMLDNKPILDGVGTPTLDNKPILDGVGTPTLDSKSILDGVGTPTLDNKSILDGVGTPTIDNKPILDGVGTPTLDNKPILDGVGTPTLDNKPILDGVGTPMLDNKSILDGVGTPTLDNKPILDGVGTPTVDTPTLDTSVYLAEEFYWVEPAVTAYEEEHPKLDNGVADNLAATVINVEQNNVELPDEDASGSGTLHCDPPWGNTSDTVCFKYEDHPARCMSTGTARTLSFLVHIIFFGMLLIIAAMGCTVRKRNREVRQLTLEVVAALNRSTERVTLSPVPDDQLMVVPPVYNSGSGSVYKSQHIYSSSVA